MEKLQETTREGQPMGDVVKHLLLTSEHPHGTITNHIYPGNTVSFGSVSPGRLGKNSTNHIQIPNTTGNIPEKYFEIGVGKNGGIDFVACKKGNIVLVNSDGTVAGNIGNTPDVKMRIDPSQRIILDNGTTIRFAVDVEIKVTEQAAPQSTAQPTMLQQLSPKNIFYGLRSIATGEAWGDNEVEVFMNKLKLLHNIYGYGSEAGLIQHKEKIHPQFKTRYMSTEIRDPVIDFLSHWGKAQLYETLYSNLVSNPSQGEAMLNELNKYLEDRNKKTGGGLPFRPFKNAEEVRIEFERHKNYAMNYITDFLASPAADKQYLEREQIRILQLIRELSE